MTKPHIVGFTGRQDAGKTTAAAHLRERHGYTGSNLTEPMDEMLAPLLRRMGVAEHEIAPRLTGGMKNTPIPGYEWLTGRKLKQALGLQFRDAVSRPTPDGSTDRCFFHDLWFGENAGHPFLVHEQIRYDFEAANLQRRGGVVVKIVDPEATRQDQHESEAIDFPVDREIANPKTGLGPLHAELDRVVGEEPSTRILRTADPIASLDAAIDDAINVHGPEVRVYADRLDGDDQDLSETIDDLITDIKVELGGDAANTANDDQAEAAIDAVAAWVTDNVSNSTSDRRVAAVFAQHGRDEAVRLLGGGATSK